MTIALDFDDEQRKLLVEQLRAAYHTRAALHQAWKLLFEERFLFSSSRLRRRKVGQRSEISAWAHANYRVFRQRATDLREKMEENHQEIVILLEALRKP